MNSQESTQVNDEFKVDNDKLLELLICPICLEFFDLPLMELPNQHVFCKKCFEKYNILAKNLSPKCPLCNIEIEEIINARYVNDLLSTVSIRCKAYNEFTKCDWFGTVTSYWNHEKTCDILKEKRKVLIKQSCEEIRLILDIEITPHLKQEHTEIFNSHVKDWDWLESDMRDWKWWWWANNPWWENKPCIICNELWHKYEKDVIGYEFKRVCYLKELKEGNK